MNIARKFATFQSNKVGRNFYRKFRFSASNYDSSHASQPQVKEEKFDFEDLKTIERTERRKPKIEPFMKNVFMSDFNRELLAYPEILNKEESEALDNRVSALRTVFSDPEKSQDDRRNVMIATNMFAGPVNLTRNGLAMNVTESIRYLEVIGDDVKLGQEISDHWVGLEALRIGLDVDQYEKIIDDLITGERPISLCIRERTAIRMKQADFRTHAEMDGKGVWRINGEKVCNNADDFLLVLAVVEAGRVKAFLVHPGAEGVHGDGTFISFQNTPGVPLNLASDTNLSRTLALSRLHAATLVRRRLSRATDDCVDYVQGKMFSGKPLSELSTIRSAIGSALLDIYASESAEYFTAGLADGYMEPDAELEMAMCRNFMAMRAPATLNQLLEVPALEQQDKCSQTLMETRDLLARGDSMHSINMFIALNGIHHAGKCMAEEIKQIRNPLFHPSFIMKKVFANRHQERDDPKLTLQLIEHLHPTLRAPAESLEYCVLRMRYACETLMGRHGKDVGNAFTELTRLAEAGTSILAMTAVLARASRSYCVGLRNADLEMKLGASFADLTKDSVKRLIKEIDDGEFLNLDHFKIQFGRKMFEKTYHVEKPTSRTFW